jgi:predicted Zn finger-like uncharacterized protein
MPFQASCPGCKATFNLAEGMLGKKVRCPQCKQVFQLPQASTNGPEATPEPDDIPEVPLASSRREDDRLQDTRSERRTRSEDRPRSRRDDDRDDRDDRRRGSSALPWILGGVGAGVLLLGGIVLVVVLAYRSANDERAQVRPPAPPLPDQIKNPVGKQLPPIELPDIPERPPVQPPEQPPEQPPVVVNNDPIEVPPALKIDPCRAPELKEERVERMLPGPIADVCVGGGGRFLILSLPSQRKLAIFDANEGKVVKYLSSGDGDVKIAAGLDRLVVVPVRGGNIQRWSLATFELEQTVPREGAAEILAISMGSASRGPLVVCAKGDRFSGATQFLSLATLKPVDVTTTEAKGRGGSLQGHFLNASADGRIFTCRDGIGGEPHTVFALVLSGRRGTLHSRDAQGSMFLPSPDGRFIYSESGIFTSELQLIHPDREISQIVNPFLPAHQGPYFARIEEEQNNIPGNRSPETGKLSIFLPGSKVPFVALSRIEGWIGQPIAYGGAPDKVMHQKRIHIIPDAKLLVTIPKSNDRLILRTVDLDKALEASAGDYLFVASRAPEVALLGAEYSYQVTAKSKKGGVKYTLEAAPPGMTVSAEGLVKWMVPGNFAEKRVDAILKVSDSSGKEAFQNLKLSVEGK